MRRWGWGWDSCDCNSRHGFSPGLRQKLLASYNWHPTYQARPRREGLFTPMYDLVIIGAGAAGLTAAVFAGRSLQQFGPHSSHRVLLVDGAEHLGAKILVSGGGRCNVTHRVVHPHDYVTSQGIVHERHPVANVLRTFSVEATIAFFRDLGVELKCEETGKLFPTSDDARTVLQALLHAVQKTEIVIRTGIRITDIVRRADVFRLTMQNHAEPLTSRRVIIATGGKSLPKTGSDGLGYQLVRNLGHTILDPFPALVPLVLQPGHWLTSLSGLSLPVSLAVTRGTGKQLVKQRGSMLCTHFGISGPVVLDISRHWIAAYVQDRQTALCCSLLPDQSFETVEYRMIEEATKHPQRNLVAVLRDMLPQRLAEAMPRYELGVEPSLVMGQLPREQRRKLVHTLTDLRLPVERDRGWSFAEVTAGGVPLREVDPRTMESKRQQGLYLCGEILDVDGRMGGYNFQWAWCSGRLAGMHAIRF